MRPHFERDILILDGVITTDLCESFIEKFEQVKPMRVPTRRQAAKLGLKDYGSNRNCDFINVFGPDWEDLHNEMRVVLDKQVNVIQDYYEANFDYCYSMQSVACYKAGEGCEPHCDGIQTTPGGVVRAGTIIVYLNSCPEGGETVFPRQNIEVKPIQGRMIFFPPTLGFPHYARPVISGKKIIAVNWLEFANSSVSKSTD